MTVAVNWFNKPTTRSRWASCLFLLLATFCSLPSPSIASVTSAADTMTPRSGVLIPLYIYPTKGAWDPLYQAIETHPSLAFTVVINPASGPGANFLPDANYTREITRLNTYPNVKPIGYVACDYGRRDINAAAADIAHYGQWADYNPDLAMQGIFLDEAPRAADDYNATYVSNIKKIIENSPRVAPGTMVTNPGSIPDSRILISADKTVVFEEQYQTYINLQAAKSLAALPERDSLVCLMHSIPEDLPISDLRDLVDELQELAGNLFLTDLSVDYYSRFSSRFADFIDVLA